jgi:glycosyltransferase involved in cell wall biosynthesis
MSRPQATVVITTKNRKEDLRKSIASALSQTVDLEVLVIDDGSADGTFDLVREEFPDVRIHRSETSQGLIVQRNRGATLAKTPIVVSIDDDAIFSTSTIMEATLNGFNHPRVGAVAIPVVDVNRSPEVRNQAPDVEKNYAIYDYIGTAHALRRDIFLKLGGYREILIHQGEEEDYCIRMLNEGFITKAGRGDPIHHFESPRRNWTRMDYFGARNKVLYAWYNVPFPQLPVHLAATTFKTATLSPKPGRLLTRLRGVMNAYMGIIAGHHRRQPVADNIYQISRELKRRGPLPFNEIEGKLPRINLPEPGFNLESQRAAYKAL